MSNKKPPRWSTRFELRPEDADHVRLHDYLESLAANDAASDWIRDTLIAALPSSNKAGAHKRELEYEDVNE